MHRYWYTFFLLISLGCSLMRTDRAEVYGKQQKEVVIQTEQVEDMQEIGKAQESVKRVKSVKEPEHIILETAKSEPVQFMETSIKENNVQLPVQSSISESGSLFPDNFQAVLFVGDSRTVGLYEYGQMEEADAFADSGMTVFNLWDCETSFNNKGKKNLEQVLTENQYQVIHFMLGINELGYSMEQIVDKYREAVGKIQSMQPEAKVVLGANLHVTAENSSKSKIFNNQRINTLNFEIQNIGDELDCYYIDVNEIFDDTQGNLSKEYSTDGTHILGKYYADWVWWLVDRK